MQLHEEIWNEINATPGIDQNTKTSLHTRIVRLVQASQTSPVGRRQGVTVQTEAGSAAGDRVIQNRNAKPLTGDAAPKSI